MAAINRDKSDQSPPPPGRCGYATRDIQVKARYMLPVDASERTRLRRLLNSCPASGASELFDA